MAQLLSVASALERVLACCRRLEAESAPLAAAAGRTLATDVVADHDLPPFGNSAMDGYAVHSEDLLGATPEFPISLPAEAAIPAGRGDPGPLPPGRCARIMTGAPLPTGADAVAPLEATARTPEGQVLFMTPITAGSNRRPRGSDLAKGARVLTAGTLLGPAELSLLAALGWAQALVTRRPRVLVISTGDELVPIDAIPGPGQIHDSSLVALPAQLAAAGAEVMGTAHAPDDPEALRQRFAAAVGVDLLITSGGVSVGDRDYVRSVFEQLGEVVFHGVAIKPGKPLLFGRLRDGGSLFFGLPGNPVASMVTLDVFVRPAIEAFLGRGGRRLTLAGRWAAAVASDPKRCEYVRVHAAPGSDGVWLATPTGDQGSGRLTSMLGANAYGIIAAGIERVVAGEPAVIELCRPPAGG
jgi:molybdopterin molybdotransferase